MHTNIASIVDTAITNGENKYGEMAEWIGMC